MTSEPKSYIRTFKKAYASACVALIVAFGILFLFGFSLDDVLGIFLLFALSSTVSVIAVNYHEGGQLTTYLQKNHPHIWKKLVPNPNIGVLGVDQIGFGRFVRSHDDMEDPIVTSLKMRQKQSYNLVILVILSFPALWLVLVALSYVVQALVS